MVIRQIEDFKIKKIANAIRGKTGKTAALTLEQMPTEIDGIETGGSSGPLQAKTAYPSHSEQIIAPDEDYYGLVSVTVKPVPRLPACEVKVVPLPNGVRYLNHKALAEIPAELLAEYPYAAIVVSPSGSMWLYLAMKKMYVSTTDEGIDKLNFPACHVVGSFNTTVNAWLMGYAYTTNRTYNINGDGNWAVWWANHDICIGSADSGEIYFPASQPQEEQPAEATHFYYNGVRRPAIPADVLAQYPYVYMASGNAFGAFSVKPYFYSTDAYPSTLKADGKGVTYKYDAETDSWVFDKEHSSVWVIIGDFHWTNYDMPNGSADATEVYFYGTVAVPDPLQGGV